MDPQTFTGVSPAKFAAITTKVEQLVGVKIEGDTGQQSRSGYTLQWEYDRQNYALTITVLKKPRFAPGFMIARRINELVESA